MLLRPAMRPSRIWTTSSSTSWTSVTTFWRSSASVMPSWVVMGMIEAASTPVVVMSVLAGIRMACDATSYMSETVRDGSNV